MTDYNLKVITADTDGPSADTELLFGSPDQSSGTPKPYSFAGIKTWTKGWSGSTHPGYVSGNWYLFPGQRPATGAALGVNSMKFMPFMIAVPVTISQLSVRVTTVQASQNFQLALYGASASTRKPSGAVLGSTANLSTAATGNISGALSGSVALVPWALYYAAINCDHAVPVFLSIHAIAVAAGDLVGVPTVDELVISSASTFSGYSSPQTFGTWPDVTSNTFTPLTGASVAPMVSFKVA